jgi:hypothetical protein
VFTAGKAIPLVSSFFGGLNPAAIKGFIADLIVGVGLNG